jgi:hypothetical protein
MVWLTYQGTPHFIEHQAAVNKNIHRVSNQIAGVTIWKQARKHSLPYRHNHTVTSVHDQIHCFRKRTIPAMRRWFLLLFALLILVLGTWAGRSYLSELILVSTLQHYRLQDVVVDIHDIGLQQSNIANISFTIVTQDGLLRINARESQLTYTPGLLSEMRIDSLNITRLTLNYESLHNNTAQKSTTGLRLEPVKLIATMRHTLHEYIAFNTLTIESIIPDGHVFGSLNQQSMQLSSTRYSGAIHTSLIYAEPFPDHADNPVRAVNTELSPTRLAVNLGFSDIKTPPVARLDLAIADTNIHGNYRINPQLLISWLEPVIDISALSSTAEINGSLSAEFKSEDQIITTLSATTGRLGYNAYSAHDAGLQISVQTSTINPLDHLKILNGSYFRSGSLNYQDVSLEGLRLNLAGDFAMPADTWQYTGGFSSRELEIHYQSQVLKLADIAGRLTATAETLASSGDFSTANLPGRFTFAIDHDFKTAAGQFDIRPVKKFKLHRNNSKFSQLLTPWPYPFDLYTGTLDLSSQAMWSPGEDFRLITGIKLDDGGGSIGEVLFSGLFLDHELEILPRLRSTHASNIRLSHLDSGITASNISTDLKIQNASSGTLPQFVITGLHGEVLGGTFTADEFVYDLNKEINRFMITASDIDLAAIVETQQFEDIEITGSVDGTLPIVINDQGILVEHGSFISKVREGIIRYRPGGGSDQLKQNPLTRIALDALEDFHYNHLSADVNFMPEGTLTINVQLKGTSPELDTERPVHLNINTEQNLLSLLKSLRFAEGVSANIDREVRRQYEKNRKQ